MKTMDILAFVFTLLAAISFGVVAFEEPSAARIIATGAWAFAAGLRAGILLLQYPEDRP